MCTFNFKLPVEPLPLLATLAQRIEEHGGTVTGDLPTVRVSIPTRLGPIEGQCALVDGTTIKVDITKKPDIVTCAIVRDRLVEYLTEAVKSQAAATATATPATGGTTR